MGPSAAARIGLRNTPDSSPVTITGTGIFIPTIRSLVSFAIEPVTAEKRWVGWLERELADQSRLCGDRSDADGSIGLESLPENRITFRLREPQPGERVFEIPVTQGVSLYIPVKLGDVITEVRFWLHEKCNSASAQAGANLATLRDGRWDGPISIEQISGAAHPFRPIKLGRPLSIAGLPLHRIFVQIDQPTGRFKLPPDQDFAQGKTEKLNDILVTGKKRKADVPWNHILVLGGDAFAGCSSLTYNKRRKVITVSCLPV